MTAPTKLTSKDILFCASEFQYCVLNPKQVGARRVMQIRWERPQQGWIRLNTEGASSGNPGLAGRGGILRNEHGEGILMDKGILKKHRESYQLCCEALGP